MSSDLINAGLLSLQPETRVMALHNIELSPFFESTQADLALRAFELAKLAERSSAQPQTPDTHRFVWTDLPVVMPERHMLHPVDDLLAICWRRLESMKDSQEVHSETRAARIIAQFAKTLYMAPTGETADQLVTRPSTANSAVVGLRLLEAGFQHFNGWRARLQIMREAVAARATGAHDSTGHKAAAKHGIPFAAPNLPGPHRARAGSSDSVAATELERLTRYVEFQEEEHLAILINGLTCTLRPRTPPRGRRAKQAAAAAEDDARRLKPIWELIDHFALAANSERYAASDSLEEWRTQLEKLRRARRQ